MSNTEEHKAEAKYRAPSMIFEMGVSELLKGTPRAALTAPQLELLASVTTKHGNEAQLFVAGNVDLLQRNCVSIIGARDATDNGKARARRLAKELAKADVVVMSGLADGIDTQALESALKHQGQVIGVIGTPLDKAYPAKNKQLQELIYRDHLLVSQFEVGEQTFQSNFPKRNRLMALLSDATVVIEATDSSGTLHQAAECVRLGRWLFIARNVVENPELAWPKRFEQYENFRVLDSTEELIRTVFNR
jgi:DNA processing protein